MFTLLYVPARFRRPVRLLECPDRASLLRPGGLPQGYAHPAAGAGTGFMRLSGRFAPLTFWKLGFRQSGFRHIARISRHAAPYASATAAGFLACYCPRFTFRSRVSHQIQRHLLQSMPAMRAI